MNDPETRLAPDFDVETWVRDRELRSALLKEGKWASAEGWVVEVRSRLGEDVLEGLQRRVAAADALGEVSSEDLREAAGVILRELARRKVDG